jgi:hypothetical protein
MCDRVGVRDRILQTHDVGAIHLSHNDGQADRHDLIPDEIWFADRLPAWREKYLVTYESLPIGQAQFERLDKRRQAIPQFGAEFG